MMWKHRVTCFSSEMPLENAPEEVGGGISCMEKASHLGPTDW
jgi:hypothetical protein